MKHIANLAAVTAMVIGGLCITLVVSCVGTDADRSSPAVEVTAAEPETKRPDWDVWEREREERWAKIEADSAQRQQELEEELSARPPQKKRRVRRFQWESPAETQGKIWSLPEEESEQATLEAFLRVCLAEADGYLQDCVGIWQVVKNNRRRSCDRGMIRRITECVEGEGETFLSALRRHQRHVLGYIKARNKRAVWVGRLTPDCENPPDGFPGRTEEERLTQWDARYQKRCSRVVELGRYLIKGELPPDRPGHRLRWLPGRPITWGGRCESGKAACDDRIACARGLARLPGVDYTKNAFWQKAPPGHTDPVCAAMGYGDTEGLPEGAGYQSLTTQRGL